MRIVLALLVSVRSRLAISAAVAMAAATVCAAFCGGCWWLPEECADECQFGESYCRDGKAATCGTDETCNSMFAHDCTQYVRGDCTMAWWNGRYRAHCVDTGQPCEAYKVRQCAGDTHIQRCLGGYVSAERWPCTGDANLCVEYVNADGRGDAECAVSRSPCPDGRASYCLHNAEYQCGESGFPTLRKECDPVAVCVEGVDPHGQQIGRCALSTEPCPPGTDSLCYGDTILDCQELGIPVIHVNCAAFGFRCDDTTELWASCTPP